MRKINANRTIISPKADKVCQRVTNNQITIPPLAVCALFRRDRVTGRPESRATAVINPWATLLGETEKNHETNNNKYINNRNSTQFCIYVLNSISASKIRVSTNTEITTDQKKRTE
jgi:hypothetical protein